MIEGDWLRELLIVLATAGVVVPLFGRLRFGVVPGFLLAGIALGPGGLGRLTGALPWLSWITFSDPERVAPFAELGVVFLLFLIGLEFSLERLWAMRRLVLGIGSVQFVASAVVIGGGATIATGSLVVGLLAGLALALSSTAIVTQTLIDAHRFATPVGRTSLGVLLFQDLMVVPIVIIVGLLSGKEVAVSGALLRGVGLAVAVLVLIALAGRYLVRPLLRLAASAGSRELVIAIALFLAIGTALLTGGVGLSYALGAFIAGILLGESEYRHQLEVDIEPFKGLLLGLFFMTVGMSLDLGALATVPLAFIGALLGLVAVKVAVAFGAARLFAVKPSVALESAFVLAGAGEFALVVFALARREGLLLPVPLQFLTSLAALTMIAIPALAGLGRRFGDSLVARQETAGHRVDDIEAGTFSDHVVIGGFGRVGETIARVLDAEQIPYVAVDLDAELVARQRQAGRQVFYGDASRQEILTRLGGASARAFVVTTDAPEAAERMVRAIRAAWPASAIHARALDPDHALRLTEAGATNVVPEALEGSLQLAGRVLGHVGLPDEAIDYRLDVQREQEIRRLSGG